MSEKHGSTGVQSPSGVGITGPKGTTIATGATGIQSPTGVGITGPKGTNIATGATGRVKPVFKYSVSIDHESAYEVKPLRFKLNDTYIYVPDAKSQFEKLIALKYFIDNEDYSHFKIKFDCGHGKTLKIISHVYGSYHFSYEGGNEGSGIELVAQVEWWDNLNIQLEQLIKEIARELEFY